MQRADKAFLRRENGAEQSGKPYLIKRTLIFIISNYLGDESMKISRKAMFAAIAAIGAVWCMGCASGQRTSAAEPGAEAGSAAAEASDGALTKVENLYSQKSALSGKTVTIKGKVVKFSAGIMGKNWLHVQDGSGGPGTNDITVTTDAVAEVDNNVTVTGVLSTDKDFGYGYKYGVIIEDAKVSTD